MEMILTYEISIASNCKMKIYVMQFSFGLHGKAFVREFMSVNQNECGRISDAGAFADFHTDTKLFHPSFIVNAHSFTSESANI